jgi:hypothetical protein
VKGGSYQNAENRAGCVDCPAGFFCPVGAVEPIVCAKGTFCGGRSQLPTPVQSGYYQVDAKGAFTVASAHNQTMCPAGFYCTQGQHVACAVGTYCPAGASVQMACPQGSYCASPSEMMDCGAGSYCPEGSVARQICEAGYFCSLPWKKEICIEGAYCPEGSVIYHIVTIGYFSSDADSSFTVTGAVRQEKCLPGKYCKNGRIFDCVEGATCSIPASPELILNPAILDKHESELDLDLKSTRGGLFATTGTTELFDGFVAQFGSDEKELRRSQIAKSDFKRVVDMLGLEYDTSNETLYEEKFKLWDRPFTTTQGTTTGTGTGTGGGERVRRGGGDEAIDRDDFARFVHEELPRFVSYNISLSSRPTAPVTVYVKQNEDEEERQKPVCSRYEHGIKLSLPATAAASGFVFTALDYNVSQAVRIVIRRNFSVYQGPNPNP